MSGSCTLVVLAAFELDEDLVVVWLLFGFPGFASFVVLRNAAS